MAKRKNIRTAGRLVTGVVYTVARPKDTEQERAAKLQVSNMAREKMNLKHSWQKLEWLTAANYSYKDWLVTLTYDDEHLPPARDAAVKRLKKFIKALKALRKADSGAATLYIYVTEGHHGLRRLHHHLILNNCEDAEAIQRLWGQGNVDFEPIGKLGYTKLAQYLTKEPREVGKWTVGERTWTPCLGLNRPKPETGWCPDNFTLTIPLNAQRLYVDSLNNGYGEFTFVKYLLPEPVKDWPKKYHRPRPERKTNRI